MTGSPPLIRLGASHHFSFTPPSRLTATSSIEMDMGGSMPVLAQLVAEAPMTPRLELQNATNQGLRRDLTTRS